jgi:hypothetical protein
MVKRILHGQWKRKEMAESKHKGPISNGKGKMSPQEAVGYGNWPDEDGRQTKHHRRHERGKHNTLRKHRKGKG